MQHKPELSSIASTLLMIAAGATAWPSAAQQVGPEPAVMTASYAIDRRQNPRQGPASITPEALRPVLGPLVIRNSGPSMDVLRTYDTRFAESEVARFKHFTGCQATCYLEASHYGGLRARLMWAIRNAEPVGPEATDETRHAYARGRRTLQRYLQWAKQHGYSAKPERNTALADVEALWLLDRDPEAYNHLWVAAAQFSQQDKYVDLTGPATSPRQPTVALMAQAAAHRLAIPFERPTAISAVGFDASQGSWKATGERIIGWVRAAVERHGGTGYLPSTAHNGREAYLFNAWLAAELLNWCGHVAWDQATFDLARRLMDHLIEVRATRHPRWETLPYTTGGARAAYDLAGFYIYPSLVLWQETGDAKYRDFALMNLRATQRAYLGSTKQWNQTYSMQGQTAEALLAGVRWR
jgi:hypothetical protein